MLPLRNHLHRLVNHRLHSHHSEKKGKTVAILLGCHNILSKMQYLGEDEEEVVRMSGSRKRKMYPEAILDVGLSCSVVQNQGDLSRKPPFLSKIQLFYAKMLTQILEAWSPPLKLMLEI